MLDYLHLPKQQNGNVDYFAGFSDVNGASWVAWEKPKGIQMIRITCIGGGAGGGSGFSSNTTGSRGGGGGGGSGAISIVTIPAYVLPDILYVSSGTGGPGASANPADGTANIGIQGVDSYVCIAPDIGVIYRICRANGGNAGAPAATSTAGGDGGSAGSISALTNMLLACYGTRNFIVGQAGGAGSTGSNAGVTYPTTGLLVSGGCGGNGGVSLTPGPVFAPTQTAYTIFSSLTSVSGSGNNGQPGREIYQPLLSTGGSGGAANSGTGAGGQGGAGGFGSGGGGGGAGGAGAAGGGGKGGDGLVIIHSW
jgi:hypothetical protein